MGKAVLPRPQIPQPCLRSFPRDMVSTLVSHGLEGTSSHCPSAASCRDAVEASWALRSSIQTQPLTSGRPPRTTLHMQTVPQAELAAFSSKTSICLLLGASWTLLSDSAVFLPDLPPGPQCIQSIPLGPSGVRCRPNAFHGVHPTGIVPSLSVCTALLSKGFIIILSLDLGLTAQLCKCPHGSPLPPGRPCPPLALTLQTVSQSEWQGGTGCFGG